MQFVIVLERGLSPVLVIGPFPHEEDASSYAKEHYGREVTIWRVVPLTAPESK